MRSNCLQRYPLKFRLYIALYNHDHSDSTFYSFNSRNDSPKTLPCYPTTNIKYHFRTFSSFISIFLNKQTMSYTNSEARGLHNAPPLLA